MLQQIMSRWSDRVVFECEIDATADMPLGVRLGLAARIAVRTRANLTDADLTYAKLTGANLTRANLTGANLTRADLTDAKLTDADLTDADLTYAKLTGAKLTDADLTRANLTRANLTYANLTRANLTDAKLTGADLTRADLTGAPWMPRIANIHQGVYAAASVPGALNMGAWHNDLLAWERGECGTTHCRAGWVIVLAGPAGRVLEGIYGTNAAAALIYAASDPLLGRVPNWFASNADALADMKARAEAEAARAALPA